LKHDKPLAATGAAAAAAHLKHLPAYLRDPSLQGKSFTGNSGAWAQACVRQKRDSLQLIDFAQGTAWCPSLHPQAVAELAFLPSCLPALSPSLPPSRCAAGRGTLPARKRRKTEGLDPVKGFMRAPRKGGEAK
jgi:hypothetical protein